MKNHTSTYLDFFGFTPADFITCEFPNCGLQANSVHHIHRRGRGGDPTADRIENLQALCNKHHLIYGDKKHFKSMLYAKHLKLLEDTGKEFDRDWIIKQIEKYKVYE